MTPPQQSDCRLVLAPFLSRDGNFVVLGLDKDNELTEIAEITRLADMPEIFITEGKASRRRLPPERLHWYLGERWRRGVYPAPYKPYGNSKLYVAIDAHGRLVASARVMQGQPWDVHDRAIEALWRELKQCDPVVRTSAAQGGGR